MSGPHYGKYRGTVVNNVDPMQLGRIQVSVPDVAPANVANWATACVPFAGKQEGLWCVPAIGAGVWVEYEQGDSDYPVWSGCFWGSVAEVPPLALTPPPAVSHVVLQTAGQNTLLLSDAPGPTGGIMLRSSSGAMITINQTGITITNGTATITLTGATVSVNNGALAVT